MCDTLCAVGEGRTIFGKNSDRPPGEVQVVRAYPARAGGGHLRTQYLELDDPGAHAVLLSQPVWLWGAEHGVNEHGVVIGNELVYTVDDPHPAAPALIGMDLVRLGLERGATAHEAVDVMTSLLERHGQGGAGFENGEPYWSSFLVADAREAWVLETSGNRWDAHRYAGGETAAISNRLVLRPEWGAEGIDTAFADVRLDASRAFLACGVDAHTPEAFVRHLRDHGGALPDTSRFTVCMHVAGISVTTASIVAEVAESAAPRVWVALGAPCASVFAPVTVDGPLPWWIGEPDVWRRFDRLRERVETDPSSLAEVRAVLDPVEAEVWDEGPDADVWPIVDSALRAVLP